MRICDFLKSTQTVKSAAAAGDYRGSLVTSQAVGAAVTRLPNGGLDFFFGLECAIKFSGELSLTEEPLSVL